MIRNTLWFATKGGCHQQYDVQKVFFLGYMVKWHGINMDDLRPLDPLVILVYKPI